MICLNPSHDDRCKLLIIGWDRWTMLITMSRAGFLWQSAKCLWYTLWLRGTLAANRFFPSKWQYLAWQLHSAIVNIWRLLQSVGPSQVVFSRLSPSWSCSKCRLDFSIQRLTPGPKSIKVPDVMISVRKRSPKKAPKETPPKNSSGVLKNTCFWFIALCI